MDKLLHRILNDFEDSGIPEERQWALSMRPKLERFIKQETMKQLKKENVNCGGIHEAYSKIFEEMATVLKRVSFTAQEKQELFGRLHHVLGKLENQLPMNDFRHIDTTLLKHFLRDL